MGIDIPPVKHGAFDPELLEKAEIVEALPFSHAFERVMYDQRIHRHARHTMNEPIILTPTFTNLIIPEEIRVMLPSSSSAIGDLTVDHHDTPITNQPSSVEDTPRLSLSFTADGFQHSMQMRDRQMIYTVETHADTLHYSVSPQVAVRFLAALVYARQYDERDPHAPIAYAESDRELPRSEDDALIEGLILTLGSLDGQSSITTTSLIGTNAGDSLFARLSEGESPIITSMQSKLELARLASPEDVTQTNLHQNIVSAPSVSVINPQPITLEKRFAEQRQPESSPVIIDPKYNFEEWVHICDTFLTAIKPYLAQYEYLDEEPV